MKRRNLLKRSLLLGTAGLVGGSGVWLLTGEDPANLTLAHAKAALQGLDLNRLRSQTAWSPSQVLEHLAQSIEYSMTGYPAHKSAWFKSTAGALAFTVFSIRATMSHNLTEAIPGAPTLDMTDTHQARQHLLAAIDRFAQHTGPLQPHFAYGPLNHQQYTWAHVMHINDHLKALVTA